MAPKLKQFDAKQLTLKQRILMSNLLMIAVPVAAAAITAGVCALVLGMLLFRGADLDANLEILEDALAFTLAGSFARGQLKLMLAAAIGLVLVAVLVACVLASRAESRLVTEHIEAQLKLLGEGLGHLAAKEFDLLLFLARNPGVVYSRDALYERVWGLDAVGDPSTVTVHIKRLRSKLGDGLIQTVRSAGYRLAKQNVLRQTE